MKSKWLFSSKTPNVFFLKSIQNAAEKLPPGLKVPKKRLSMRVKHASGGLDKVLTHLQDILNIDYAEHLEENEESYTFEYVVSDEGFGKSALGVLTRLFSEKKTEMGGVLYGHLVVRDSETKFSLWTSEE